MNILQQQKHFKKGFTRTLTLALFSSVFSRICEYIKNMKKILHLSFFQRSNKNTMPKLVSGFTLVEALVAISILMIAIASPMLLAQKGLSTATLSKDQMIAAFLAQDAIEAVKNIRDQIAVKNNPTNDWLIGTILDTGGCICRNDTECNLDNSGKKYCAIKTTSSQLSGWELSDIIPNTPTEPGPLKTSYNTIGLFEKYDYGGSVDSKFTRYINIRKDPANSGNQNEAVVHVRVSWNSALGDQKIDISDFIYNYSENY